MRAIDLYAGIGGWSLGLRLAGVEVVASYEWWKPAIETHKGNHGGDFGPVDIRKLNLDTLPTNIDMVVGSPPCTEFSYSNRGGSGDIAEGMKDLVRFFEVVDRLKPRFWAMENVPRVAEVLRAAFADPDHILYQYRHLRPNIEVLDFSEFGTPQARRRCIATNIPFENLKAYQPMLPKRTLGDVLNALAAQDEVVDPLWGVVLRKEQLTETQAEPALNSEELRMNREAKEYHPIYNNMAFPDPIDHPARTITATCTRVSRESIIIADPRSRNSMRRLTIRERACLQGFPITYQFFARSFAEKAKMVGNAIPPTVPYLLALAARGVKPDDFAGYMGAADKLVLPDKVSPVTLPDKEGRSYPPTRAFRAALPGLRFKSGMRFELANVTDGMSTEWRIRFFFGQSKDIREIDLEGDASLELKHNFVISPILESMQGEFAKAASVINRTDPESLQLAWSHRCEGIGPYDIVDQIGALASNLVSRLDAWLDAVARADVADYVLALAEGGVKTQKLANRAKLERNAVAILAGVVVGEWFNGLHWHSERLAAA